MILSFLILLVLLFCGIKPRVTSFNDDYLSKEGTASIKGCFVIIVFFSHWRGYVSIGNAWYDYSFSSVCNWIGQLMVVMFFFYSGYGILMQIRERGDQYVNPFLKRRLFPVWLQFALCLVLFLIVDVILGLISKYSWYHILLSFTGWTAIGNSNWFMFVTFALYLFVFLSFILFKFKDVKWNVAVFTICSALLMFILYFLKESYWWNTLICFSLGMWYGCYRNKIDVFMKKTKNYLLVVIPLAAAFFALWIVNIKIMHLGKWYVFLPPLFAILVVAVTMKFKIGNTVLSFFGRHVFSIFILQRIPMMLFKDLIQNIYLNFLVCFLMTVLLSVGFDFLFSKLKNVITGNPRDNNSRRSALP